MCLTLRWSQLWGTAETHYSNVSWQRLKSTLAWLSRCTIPGRHTIYTICSIPQQEATMTDLTKRAFGAVAVGAAIIAATAAIAQPIVCIEDIDDDWCWVTEGGKRVR